MLREAMAIHQAGESQKAAACLMGVDERELRDYEDFVNGRSRFSEITKESTRKTVQAIIDQAYDVYRDTSGCYPFTNIIIEQSSLFGVNNRMAVELWEIDPILYPTHYRGIK